MLLDQICFIWLIFNLIGSFLDTLFLLDAVVLFTLLVRFSTAHFLGRFATSGQFISDCVSTVDVFTVDLVAATAWTLVDFTDLNISIYFLASVYEIPLSVFIFLISFSSFHFGHVLSFEALFPCQLTHVVAFLRVCMVFLPTFIANFIVSAVKFSMTKLLTLIASGRIRNKL